MPTGTYSLEDLRKQRFASAAEFGLDTINRVLQRDLAYHNAQVLDQMKIFAEPLTEQGRVYGTSASNPMHEYDEYGVAPSHKTLPGATVHFPLRLYKNAVAWTTEHFETCTPEEIVEQYLKAKRGHGEQLILQMRRAVYNSANYQFFCELTNNVELTIRRLVNADSQPIADSPAGVEFDPDTHTHYIARAAALANADIDGLVEHVTEHGHTRGIKIIVALDTDMDAIMALSEFIPLGDGGIVYNATDSTLVKMTFDDLENRLIGYWRASNVQVWVKPWAEVSYFLCIATDVPEKVVGFRQRKQPKLQGLRILAPYPNDYPLIAQDFQAVFGMGIWNRTAAAVLYTGGTQFSDPGL